MQHGVIGVTLCNGEWRVEALLRLRLPVLLLVRLFQQFVLFVRDFVLAPETSQQPLFRLLGSPPADKQYVVLESGHGPPFTPWYKETLDWLDRYLGPVE